MLFRRRSCRNYSDPVQEYLEGNCTCDGPERDALSSTTGVQESDDLEVALRYAHFCSAWSCNETRYTRVYSMPPHLVLWFGTHMFALKSQPYSGVSFPTETNGLLVRRESEI